MKIVISNFRDTTDKMLTNTFIDSSNINLQHQIPPNTNTTGKTITNELLDEFLDSHAEISMDVMEELRIFEKFLDNESHDIFNNEFTCGEVILNKQGVLIYKCNLCEANGEEFVNVANYEEHLRIYHSNTTKIKRLQSQKSDNFCVIAKNFQNNSLMEEILKMENFNYATHSSDFLENLEEALELTESHPTNNNKIWTTKTSIKDIYSNIETTNSKIKKHKKRTPGYCEICQRRFNDLYNLRVHMMIHTGEKPFQCEDCGKKFRQYNKLKIHRVTHTNKRPFICDICGKGFRFQNYLSVHKRLHSGEKPYKCHFCEEFFHSLHTRRLHMKIQHAATEMYTCTECGKILTSQCYLTAHMKRHSNQRDYECNICKKRFFSLSQLKDHQLSHTNVKPFECHICCAKFQRKSNFNQHLKIHSNVKSYICSICQKAFAQNAGLYGHMKSHAKS